MLDFEKEKERLVRQLQDEKFSRDELNDANKKLLSSNSDFKHK
jgi:hypothetical protein